MNANTMNLFAFAAAAAILSTAGFASADDPPAASAAQPAPSGPDDTSRRTEETLVPLSDTEVHAARLDKLETELAQVKEQLAAAEAQPERRLLSFWGFMDANFGGIRYDDGGALYRIQTPSHATFFSSGVNLYAKSEMTRTLSALVEVRLTYSPDGYADSWRGTAYVGDRAIAQVGEPHRTSTLARGAYSQLLFNQSGLLIERAHMDWKPVDWFGLRVGRFLTPFGIWNEDHGSPVLLGVDYPQLMNFGLVPIWQLGVQAFGSVPLTDSTHLDYAATVTNTRGPYDAYKDTTDFKALGGRLKLVHDGRSFKFRVGAYGYVSHYRETEDTVSLRLTPGLTLDPNARPSFGSTENTTVAFDETVLTGDVELRWGRLRVFGEAVRRTVIYDLPKKIDQTLAVLQEMPLNTVAYDSSYHGWAAYVLGGYEVPVKTRFANLTVTPYAGYDYVLPSSNFPVRANTQIRGGLNIKPSPYITLKLEAIRILPESTAVASEATALISQLAISF